MQYLFVKYLICKNSWRFGKYLLFPTRQFRFSPQGSVKLSIARKMIFQPRYGTSIADRGRRKKFKHKSEIFAKLCIFLSLLQYLNFLTSLIQPKLRRDFEKEVNFLKSKNLAKICIILNLKDSSLSLGWKLQAIKVGN